MPRELTEITEITTALGMLAPTLDQAIEACPAALNVPTASWQRLKAGWSQGDHRDSFDTAFENGRAFLHASDGLRERRPIRVEWKGPHRPPGDDVIPADLRVDHVYLVSCKYLSRVLLNAGPQRLFERLLVGDGRDGTNWFARVAEPEYQAFYEASVGYCGLAGMPTSVAGLGRSQQGALKKALRARTLPPALQPAWQAMCRAVSSRTARLWSTQLNSNTSRLRLLWRMLRISGAAYFVLGTDTTDHLRLRIDSAWDWMQKYELRGLAITERHAGQPEVGWRAVVRRRVDGSDVSVNGHVEIRWSHGRFYGVPEAKVYLDTPHAQVPGYNPLT